MRRHRLRTWAALCGLPCVFVRGGPVHAQAQFPPLLELRVPAPPTLATGENGSFLAYELHVTNFLPQTIRLTRVAVTSGAGDGSLLSVADSALVRSTARPGATASADERTTLPGGSRAVVYLWVPLDGAAPPSTVRHRVTFEQRGTDSVRTRELVGPAVPVSTEAARIGPPLRGGVWLTANGPANETGHRRALIPVDGTPAIAQRFAIDYVELGEDNRTFSGDSLSNESYHAHGEEALAVADGVVASIKDGIPENVPGPTSRAVPITMETVGGNFVILDIGGGRFAFYAHLIPGSLRVREGERVQRGQVVGLVGNSGNSTEPHLHFHLSDGNSPLGSEGLPYAHDSFELVGRCRVLFSGCERIEPVQRLREIPIANQLVRFAR